jgi:neutral ceramidase
MRHWTIQLAAGLVALLSNSGPLTAADLQIATAVVDITGPQGYQMGGYGARKEANRGVHDPLLAKVLLLKSDNRQFGIVTYDLVLFASSRVAREAREKLGISPVLQIATHTHSGPIPKDRQSPEQDAWFRATEDKVLQALREAQSRYMPAQLSVLEGSVYIGHNRRKVKEDGTVAMFWRNADRIPTAPVDPRIGILRFTDAAGRVLAVLVNYACHAVVLGPDNLDYSADWPGYMYRQLERQLGSPAVAYFIPGAGGDINPYNDKQPVSQDGFGIAQKTGETVAAAVLSAMKAKPPVPETFDLQVSQELYDFRDRFKADARVPTQATHILFSKDVGVLAIPAEPFVQHQINLRDQSPLKYTFLFGYAFGGEGKFTGYIPTIQAAMEGGYGANYATRVAVGAGERLVDDAVIWFYKRLGKLRDVPDKP